jgi:NitT/TauT family transport system permease protein
LNKTLLALRLAVLVIFFGLWQYLPTIPSISENTFLNTFFISSPTKIYNEIIKITIGSQKGFLFGYLWHTVQAAVIGLVTGFLGGYVAGVLLSESKLLDNTLRPYLIFINNIPRILIIPIIIIIFGFGQTSEVIAASIGVFYIIFFNAYEGGRSVDPALISFSKILGAKRRDILFNIRLYNALVWSLAQLPNAASFALLGTITAEVLGTGNGIGYLIVIDLSNFDTTGMYALILVTALFGFTLILAVERAGKSLIKWNRLS